VRLRGLGAGVVLEAPRRGRVTVQVGGARTTAALFDVALAADTTARHDRRTHAATSEGDQAPADTLDLRGARVDEGVSDLERFLNASYLLSYARVRVVHGHGTGSLKAAVRGHLEGHPLVAGWKPAAKEQGGDGVTLVDLDT
jgi:DNA mismatch repair protein MutS2